jgi:hypothetical protein
LLFEAKTNKNIQEKSESVIQLYFLSTLMTTKKKKILTFWLEIQYGKQKPVNQIDIFDTGFFGRRRKI